MAEKVGHFPKHYIYAVTVMAVCIYETQLTILFQEINTQEKILGLKLRPCEPTSQMLLHYLLAKEWKASYISSIG